MSDGRNGVGLLTRLYVENPFNAQQLSAAFLAEAITRSVGS